MTNEPPQTPKARRKSALQTEYTVSEHSQRRRSTSDSRDEQCHAIIETSDEQPDICTIYSTAPGDSVVTTWISAESESYVSLENYR